MKIDHAAMYVCDLEGARDFFVTYFGAVSNDGYHNKSTGFRSYFLTFDGKTRLEIMHRPGLDTSSGPACRTGYSHLAFCLGSAEAVDRLTERMKADGYPVISGPRVTGDGYYESCIEGFEGNIVELTV